MGIGIVRIGDVGEGNCSDHGSQRGIIVSTSEDVFTDGIGTGFLTSKLIADCNDTALIISGSETVFTDGISTAYIGSSFEGSKWSGIVIAGSEDVFSG